MPVWTQPEDRSTTQPVRWYLRRLQTLAPSDLLLLGRTFALLLLARTALAVLPVRYIVDWKRRTDARGHLPASERETGQRCRRVAWAVDAVVRHSPVRFVCFPQALAAHRLLSASGVPTRLHYGVRRQEGKLETHAWLEAAGQSIVGGEAAEGFTTVAIY